MKVFKSSTHSYPILTNIWISQSVFHQSAWFLAVFDNQSGPVFLQSLIFKYIRPRLQSGLFSGPVWSFSGLFPVFRPDFQTLTKREGEREKKFFLGSLCPHISGAHSSIPWASVPLICPFKICSQIYLLSPFPFQTISWSPEAKEEKERLKKNIRLRIHLINKSIYHMVRVYAVLTAVPIEKIQAALAAIPSRKDFQTPHWQG